MAKKQFIVLNQGLIMNTIKNKTMESNTKLYRKAQLPMTLMNEGDLELINNSNMRPEVRDVAVCYMMAKCLLEKAKGMTGIYKTSFTDDLNPLKEALYDLGYEDMLKALNKTLAKENK